MSHLHKILTAFLLCANFICSAEGTPTQNGKDEAVHFSKNVNDICLNGTISLTTLDNAKLPSLTLVIENKSKLPVHILTDNPTLLMMPKMLQVIGQEPRKTRPVIQSDYYTYSLQPVSLPIRTIEPGQSYTMVAPVWRWFDLSGGGKFELSFTVPFSLGVAVNGGVIQSAKFDAIEINL